MKDIRTDAEVQTELLKRRRFLTGAGGAGLAAAAALVLPGKANALIPSVTTANPKELDNTSGDTVVQILTDALIAEDLATTFYYFGLVGPVIQDPNLAGPGGKATAVGPGGNQGNVNYIQAALYQEIEHANLLRALISGANPGTDPVQTFYLPTGTFNSLASFTSVLNALESAFIGAYLAATLEFAQMACDSRAGGVRQSSATGSLYSSSTLEYLAQLSASIMGVECEHRVLGRDLSSSNPANNVTFEQTDGIATVNNGGTSAVTALTPFLGPGAGMTAYSYRTAMAGSPYVYLKTAGAAPPVPPVRQDGQ